MKNSLTSLSEKYPSLFDKEVLFGCRSGWYGILDNLFEQIVKALANEPEEYRVKFRIIQVKEKFGGLRVYKTGGNEAIDRLIEEAQWESFKVCERCGNPGRPAKVGHRKETICDTCLKQF